MKRRYNFDITVSSADELEGVGDKLTKFIREFGDAEEVDVNVSIEQSETNAIGFMSCNEEDYDDEEDGEMSKELEEILDNLPYSIRYSGEIEPLKEYAKEQAERVQELEDKLARIRFVNNDYDKQNKRYREALRKIIKEGENGEYSHYTAQRALEEKTDE